MNEMPLLLIRIKQNYKLASVLKDVAYCCIDFFIDRHIWACVSVTRDILVERKSENPLVSGKVLFLQSLNSTENAQT